MTPIMAFSPPPPSTSRNDITDLLLAWRGGNDEALERLVSALYRQLKALAAACLRGEHHQQVFQTTELVHESFVRLVEIRRVDWRDRAHFLALCARVMRRVLIDHARARNRLKRATDAEPLPFDEARDGVPLTLPDLVALDDALRDLARVDPEMARVVELRFFGGLNRDQIATVVGTSNTTVTRRWRMARAWLTHAMAPQGPARA